MGFNSAFKRVKIVKNPANGRLNNLNDPVLNVLKPTAQSPNVMWQSRLQACRFAISIYQMYTELWVEWLL